MLERELVLGDFAGLIGDNFIIQGAGDETFALTLREAEALDARKAPRGFREPFSLIFAAADPRVLPQGIYRLVNDGLGEVAIFLVPVAKDADGVSYQATFN